VTMLTNFEVSEVMGCWFSSMRSPSSHSDAKECVCGCSARRITSFAFFDELLVPGGYPWMVILVEASLLPFNVGVRVPDDEEAETMDAGTTLDTTLETVERSTTICQLCSVLDGGGSNSFQEAPQVSAHRKFRAHSRNSEGTVCCGTAGRTARVPIVNLSSIHRVLGEPTRGTMIPGGGILFFVP
jgi:hypothetical protein